MAGGDIFSSDTKSDTRHAAPAGGCSGPKGGLRPGAVGVALRDAMDSAARIGGSFGGGIRLRLVT